METQVEAGMKSHNRFILLYYFIVVCPFDNKCHFFLTRYSARTFTMLARHRLEKV